MKGFEGTKRLVRLALRRDRITLPVTLVLALSMSAAGVPALSSTYPDYEEQLSYIAASAPSLIGRLFQGTVQGVNLGSIVMAEIFIFTSVILAIVSAFIISRHTRHNEETGAGELIGSGVVGRNAPLTAALIVAVGFNTLFGAVLFLALSGVPELGSKGSLMFSVSISMVGIMFAGIASITTQLSDYRRGANMMAISVLGVFFVLRGAGDALGEVTADFVVSPTLLSWLSPLGWAYQTLPFSQNRLFPLLMVFGFTVFTILVGYFLLNHRDIGSSIFESKAGRDRAKKKLLRAIGLPKKLMTANYIAWLLGFVISGVMVGVMVNDFRETFEENEIFQEVFLAGMGGDFVDLLIGGMMAMMAAILSGYLVNSLSKMSDEETSGRLESLMATGLSRSKWLFSYVGLVVSSLISMLVLMGVSAWLSYQASLDGVAEISWYELIGSAVVSLPAMLVFMSLIVFVFAASGKFVKSFAWALFAYNTLIGSFEGIFSLPSWVGRLSPFTHTPAYPSASLDWKPLLIMSAISLLLFAVSFVLFNRRDLSLK